MSGVYSACTDSTTKKWTDKPGGAARWFYRVEVNPGP